MTAQERIDQISNSGLKEWDGICLELVNELNIEFNGSVLFIRPTWADHALSSPDETPWSYHAAMLLDGLVYDPFFPASVLSPHEFVKAVFGGVAVEITVFSDDGPENGSILDGPSG